MVLQPPWITVVGRQEESMQIYEYNLFIPLRDFNIGRVGPAGACNRKK